MPTDAVRFKRAMETDPDVLRMKDPEEYIWMVRQIQAMQESFQPAGNALPGNIFGYRTVLKA